MQHLLLIEDDPAVARSLKDGLSREGYLVSHKTSGREGIAAALKLKAQLIILDLRLPDMSGFDVCRELRNHGCKQPILILTVERDEIDKVMGLEIGADDYLNKPYSLRELLARIRALLRRAYGELATQGDDVQYVRDLVIDRSRAQVLRGDKPINLTPTEFRLLTYLARNPGYALSRDRIIEAVWGNDTELEDERTINVHIRRLREKVELDPSRPTLILTVPGVGYCLSA